MAIGVTQIHIRRVLRQCDIALTNMHRDMRNNAIAWKTAATAQTTPQATLAGWMNNAAAIYQSTLAQFTALQADAVNWPKVRDMFITQGGSVADFTAMMTPMTAVANQLGPADKSTYAAIITACNQILAAVEAPLSLWPE